MTIHIIQDRLNSYTIKSKQEELNALKEIYQEIALAGLARSDFFKQAAFQGGTCLRIIHQIRRFSEDLDFMLLKPNPAFEWRHFLNAIELEFNSFGVSLHLKERAQAVGSIKTAFLKEDSFARILELTYDRLPSNEQTIKIKLEIDINPPIGSVFDHTFLNYPYPFSIVTQDLPSLFAGKCHALLCRKYIKGRDWFDFLWYTARKTSLNTFFLKKALEQSGPYQGKNISEEITWVKKELENKVQSIDWKIAREDVENFLPVAVQRFIQNWSELLFLKEIEKM